MFVVDISIIGCWIWSWVCCIVVSFYFENFFWIVGFVCDLVSYIDVWWMVVCWFVLKIFYYCVDILIVIVFYEYVLNVVG